MSGPTSPTLAWGAEADRIRVTERPPVGIQFTERMRGWFSPTVAGGSDDGVPREAGKEPIECTLTVIADDLERMLNGWSHEARLIGTVFARSLSASPMTVRRGRFGLFQVVRDRVGTRRIRYRMKLTSQDGGVYYLLGFKEVRNSHAFNAWFDLSTMIFAIFDGAAGKRDAVLGVGVMKLSLGDFLRQLTTIRARHAQRFAESLDARARFVGFFVGILLSTYGRVLAPSTIATPDAPHRAPQRRGRLGRGDRFVVTTSDGVQICLTRHRGGSAGPVMLVPGFTTTASSFATATVETSLVQYLYASGFDVWLLDYRASPASPAAWTSFTIDDIARRDYPAAVQKVLDCTHRNKVQILAHCVGSISLFMSILDGQLDGRVHSVVCSQIAAHMVTVLPTQVKSGLFLAALLRQLGVRQISADFNPRTWSDWALDQILKLYPTHERCNNPVCRRLMFIFHEIYRHEQLNTETHDALWQWFGTSSMTALKQLSLIVRTGHVVDAEGQDVYLEEDKLERLTLPISFMHGARNRVFPPDATLRTYETLCSANGPEWYRRQEFEGYDHMDCFIGRNAARDIFPWIVAQLQDPPHP